MRAFGAKWEQSAGSDGAAPRTAEEEGEEKIEEGETASAKTLVSARRDGQEKKRRDAGEEEGDDRGETEERGRDRSSH
jgi:hypothetical protein